MRNYQNRQQDFAKKSQVVDLVDNLLEKFSLSKGHLAEKMSYDRASFSRIYNGKETPPERFVLIGQLMLENWELKTRLDAIESAQRTLAALTAPAAPFGLNDSTAPATATDPISAKTAQKIKQSVVAYQKRGANPTPPKP